MSTRPSVKQARTRYAFIKAHRKRYSVQSMCRELGVAQSGYYAWLRQPTLNHDQEDALGLAQLELLPEHEVVLTTPSFQDLLVAWLPIRPRKQAARVC